MNFKKLLTLVILVLICGSLASADEFDCLRRLQGGTVRWDMDWQKDRTDDGVIYRIVNISESQPQRNLHEVALELLAVGPAKIAKRVSRIRLDHAAELFCKRATPVVTETRLPISRQLVKLPESVDSGEFAPTKVPFRVFREGRWVPARTPSNVALKLCVTMNAVFSCSQADWAEMRRAGRLQKLAGRGALPLPFIRFRDGGWVRGSPADLPRMGSVTTCEVLGRRFSCLEDEKNAYAPQLKRIEARYGLQQRSS